MICSLKSNGGLDVIDLTCQNDALLLKWIWRLEKNPNGIWASTITRLYGISEASHIEHASDLFPFLKSLSSLLPFYRCSVESVNGLQWHWTSSGLFPCLSAYIVMHQRGVLHPSQGHIWNMKAPMKVRIFVWLMRANKILTQPHHVVLPIRS